VVTIAKKIFSVFSSTERFIFLIAFILALASFFGLGALFIQQKTVAVPARGGVYTEGLIGQPTYPNPILASTETDKSLVRLLFGNLTDVSDTITSEKDGRAWNIRLKENIFWSDGEKLTSDDVIFTVEKIQDSESKSPLSPGWRGVSVQRISELELRFELDVPYTFFRRNLKDLYIVPKHLFAETPVANWRLSRYNLQPIGSGPYAFDSYESRADGFITAYRLKANNHSVAGQPLITSFNFEFFPNADALLHAFNGGQIDGFADFDPGDINRIKRTFEEYDFSLPNYYGVFFNQNQSLPLQDEKVRTALDNAVDRGYILNNVLKGKGRVSRGPLSDSVLADSQTESVSSSLELARHILDADGWHIGSSTTRQKQIKKTAPVDLEFNLSVPQIPFLFETAKELQRRWQSIGAKVNLIILSPEAIANDSIKNRNYQALLFGNALNPEADLFAFWHSSQRFYPGLNLSLYTNKRADQLMSDIRRTADQAVLQKKLNDLQNLITNDHPAIFLYSPYYLYFARKDLHSLNPGPIEELSDRFRNIKDWYLKTARTLK